MLLGNDAWGRKVRRSGFGWQALLILLPVGVLAALGFHALRRTAHGHQDAVQRAQGIANDCCRKLWLTFQDTNLPPSLTSED